MTLMLEISNSAGRPGGQIPSETGAPVRRPVVDKQQFVILEVLAQDTLDCLSKKAFGIEENADDRDARRVHRDEISP